MKRGRGAGTFFFLFIFYFAYVILYPNVNVSQFGTFNHVRIIEKKEEKKIKQKQLFFKHKLRGPLMHFGVRHHFATRPHKIAANFLFFFQLRRRDKGEQRMEAKRPRRKAREKTVNEMFWHRSASKF